ncbi:hypothetical protein RCOM_0521620 [Ricinus communis]|uniref:Inner centromere protein ARK-binding domain-containing protein n=1 Tax=Ricinus communis TaxID=3988 RepID=B9S9R8_RICCO|nr:hypothetical protein RCOM_0521620 [Ricinus communis]
MEKAKGDSNLQPVPQSEPVNTKVSTIDTINASVIAEDHKTSSDCGDNLKVMASIREVSESGGLNSSITQEQSYEISPYKGSDDEDEDEDDDIRKSKFIPSWASKCHLALVVSSQQRIVPESIFPPESFCSISEGNLTGYSLAQKASAEIVLLPTTSDNTIFVLLALQYLAEELFVPPEDLGEHFAEIEGQVISCLHVYS